MESRSTRFYQQDSSAAFGKKLNTGKGLYPRGPSARRDRHPRPPLPVQCVLPSHALSGMDVKTGQRAVGGRPETSFLAPIPPGEAATRM